MKEKARLSVYRFRKGNPVPGFKKTLSLPAYLYKQDDFVMFIAKHCGCHFFHISYTSTDKKTRRLCDIKINRIGQKQVEYALPYQEDQQRLILFLERNRKERHLMKETTSAGKNKKNQKSKKPVNDHIHNIYG